MTDIKKKADTVCENFRILKERAENNREQIRLSARQLGSFLTEDVKSLDKSWKKMTDIEASAVFKITLCQYLCQMQRYRDIAECVLRGEYDGDAKASLGRIAYVRNKRNDKVFLEFSKTVGGAKAYYSQSFADACEAVFNNTCEFCILPIYNGKEGKLYSFYTMLDRHELKIAYIVTEDHPDSEEAVTFALAGRRLSLPEDDRKCLRFEFSLIGENIGIVSEITEAVGEIGGVVTDVGTLPIGYDQPRRKFYLSADIPPDSIIPLVLYLSMEDLGFEVLGLYGL